MPAEQVADVLVLGAGPAGLAAAWRAARRGLSVTVLERAPRVGGLSASIEVAGVRADLGSHRLHPNTSPRVLADIRALLGDDLQLRRRNGRLRLGDSWVAFPLRPGELVRALPPRVTAGITLDAVTAGLRRPHEQTYAAQVRAGLGPTVYRELYGPFAAKLWGLPGEEIHADQARVRVTADSAWKVAARLVRGGRAGGSSEQGRSFYYPARGFGQIAEAVAHAARSSGARIILGAGVTRLDAREAGVVADLVDGTAARGRICLSTLPVTSLGRLTGRQSSAGSDVTDLRFRAMVLVYLVHGSREPWTPYDAHYLPQPTTPVSRLSEPTNYRASAVDPPDRRVICAEIPCAVGDSIWKSTDSALVAVVETTLAEHGLPQVSRVGSQVVRLPSVYPVYDLRYRERLAAQQRLVADMPSVVTFGRLGLFAHDNSHHAMLEGYEAVDCLREDGSFDSGAWADALARFAGHRVED